MKLRSLLYVPAHNPRFLEKAAQRGADVVILDLEDSVPESAKDAARESLAAALSSLKGQRSFVRVNSGARLKEDLSAAQAADGIVLPKASLAGLNALHLTQPVLATIEDPAALLEAATIAQHPAVWGLNLGSEDFAQALGAAPTPPVLKLPKLMVHYAAKAAGKHSFGLLRSIADYQDLPALTEAIREAAEHGFEGASCVHPSLVPLLNDGFAPTAEDVAWAKRLLSQGQEGAFEFEGRMVDAPVLARARDILARA